MRPQIFLVDDRCHSLWGWWGLVSLIVTPYFLVNNIVRYLGCLRMPPVPEGAVVEEIYHRPATPIAPRHLPPRRRDPY